MLRSSHWSIKHLKRLCIAICARISATHSRRTYSVRLFICRGAGVEDQKPDPDRERRPSPLRPLSRDAQAARASGTSVRIGSESHREVPPSRINPIDLQRMALTGNFSSQDLCGRMSRRDSREPLRERQLQRPARARGRLPDLRLSPLETCDCGDQTWSPRLTPRTGLLPDACRPSRRTAKNLA